MKAPTHEMKPDRKLLKGKVPTSRQYRNCSAPVSKIYSKYASTTFSLLGVVVVYSSRNREITDMTEFDMILPSNFVQNGPTSEFCTSPLPQSNEWRVLVNRKRRWCYKKYLPSHSETGATKKSLSTERCKTRKDDLLWRHFEIPERHSVATTIHQNNICNLNCVWLINKK